MRAWPILALASLSTACSNYVNGPGSLVNAPTNLIYTLEASGTPGSPSGILLQWDFDNDPNLQVWNIYSRASTTDSYRLRGSTTSNSFHDSGVPHLQYYVTAEDLDGIESPPSNVISVDERLALAAPTTLTSTSLNGAVSLAWTDNAFTSDPQRFKIYRVYSTTYDLDNNLCGATWSLEGTTVAPEFISSALTNGVPFCFGVSAESVEGYESLWSPLRNDTPRPDARNVVVYARQFQDAGSGFSFWRDLNTNGQIDASELGLPGSGSSSNVDFSVERDVTGALFLTPVIAGVGVEQYGTGPVADLTSIDLAPNISYSHSGIQALPGFGYVFEMNDGPGFFLRYGAVRVTHVGQNYLILDWSYQTDSGNPELLVGHL